jgi:hypothetical protein
VPTAPTCMLQDCASAQEFNVAKAQRYTNRL